MFCVCDAKLSWSTPFNHMLSRVCLLCPIIARKAVGYCRRDVPSTAAYVRGACEIWIRARKSGMATGHVHFQVRLEFPACFLDGLEKSDLLPLVIFECAAHMRIS